MSRREQLDINELTVNRLIGPAALASSTAFSTATLTATTGNVATVNATTVAATTGNITTVNATTVAATTGNITTVNATTGAITTVNATTVNATTVNATTIGHGSNTVAWGAAAPVAGAHLVGDIVFDTGVAAAGTIGWVCTTAGTPGTWKTWGAVAA